MPVGSQTLGCSQPKPLTCIQPLATHRQFLSAIRRQTRGEHAALDHFVLADDPCAACWQPKGCLLVSSQRLLASRFAPVGSQTLGYLQPKSVTRIQFLTTNRQFLSTNVQNPATKHRNHNLVAEIYLSCRHICLFVSKYG